MKLYLQVAILFLYSLLGELIKFVLHISIPGSIIGIALLFFSFKLGLIKPEDLHNVCQFLLDNLTILFVPAGVALINYYSAIRTVWPILLVIVAICSIVTMISVGWSAQWAEKIIMKRPKQTASLLQAEEENIHE